MISQPQSAINYLVPTAFLISKQITGVERIRLTKDYNYIFVIFYIWAVIYIILFRLTYDIVGSNEPEYYPMEIISTCAVILSLILSAFIYYEYREQTGEKDRLYFLMIIIFIAYFLAENNWLLGREYFVGTVIYTCITGIVFLWFLKRLFTLDRLIFLIFLLGLAVLALSTIIDAINDDLLPITFDHPRRILFEEIPELFATILILHAMFLLYRLVTRTKCSFKLSQQDAMVFLGSVIILGYGNTYLLEDEGQPIPFYRIIIGLILYLIGVLIPLIYFKYPNLLKKLDFIKFWR